MNNASYLLAIVPIHSVTIMMGAIDRVRSVLTNQMQENILYLCFIVIIESNKSNKMVARHLFMPASIRKLSSALCLFCSIN